MCPQSLFKLKPDFDLVLRDIILSFDDSNINNINNHRNRSSNDNGNDHSGNGNKAYVVLTEGRRKSWTEEFWQRLRRSVPEIISRVGWARRLICTSWLVADSLSQRDRRLWKQVKQGRVGEMLTFFNFQANQHLISSEDGRKLFPQLATIHH